MNDVTKSNSSSKETSLTDKQTKLVDTIVAEGCSVTKASQIAGYAKGESGRVSASRALRLEKVQKYMLQQVAKTLGLGAGLASSHLLRLAKGSKSEYVQLQACIDILDRTGFKAPEKHQHQVIGDVKVNIDLG